MIKFYSKYLATCILAFSLNSCGLETTQTLTVLIYGVNVIPEGVEGTTTPYNTGLTLTGISMNTSVSGAIQPLSGVSTELTVIDRSQKILEYDLSSLVEETISELTVTIDTAYTAQTIEEEFTGSLTSGDLVLAESLLVETGKSITINVKVNWKNIIAEGVLSEPSFTLEKD